jgi:hypothetical protein
MNESCSRLGIASTDCIDDQPATLASLDRCRCAQDGALHSNTRTRPQFRINVNVRGRAWLLETEYLSIMRADGWYSVPNCERCLTPMVVAGTEDHPYWLCVSCAFVRLS